MKYLYIILLLLSTTINTYAQTGWKELDAFHQLSNQTLHPAIAGNLQPIKQDAAQLLTDAITWQQSNPPKSVDPQFKANLAELVKECTSLNEAVKSNRPDEGIITLAGKAHKTFHVLLAEYTSNH